MMNTSMRELISATDTLSREKGITREQVSEAIREGIKTSLRKNFPETANIRIEIDEDQGIIRGYSLYKLVNQIEDVNCEMLFNEITDEIVIDGYVHEEFPVDLNRQQINITKQVTLNKIRNDSQNQQVERLIDEEQFNFFSGTIKVSRREEFIVDCRGVELSIPKAQCLPRDSYSVNDKIFFSIIREKNNWIGSRTSDTFLIELFKSKIPEVADGVVEITACARNPGFRAKVVVKSNEPRVSAMAACIGPRGANIKSINNFMNQENVDVIQYDENIANLLISAIAPVNVNSIIVDEDEHCIEFSCPDEDISQAIGKGGKNIDLIGRLLGWKVKAYNATEWDKYVNSETSATMHMFMQSLSCDQNLAQMLVDDGFDSLDSIIYTHSDEFTDLDVETVNELKANAKETKNDPARMAVIEGMSYLYAAGLEEQEVQELQKNGVRSMQDIADLATDEFTDVLPDFDKEKASAIIMKARAITSPEVSEVA